VLSNFDKSSINTLFFQIMLVAINTFIFLLLSFSLQGLMSFIAPFCIYWLLLIISFFYLKSNQKIISSFQELFKKSQNALASITGYIPAILVLAVTIIPLTNELNFRLLTIAIVIGLINGFLEEVFWRGSIYNIKNKSVLILSTVLFALNHCGFLFLNIKYQGGAANLIGGPLLMGFIWLYAAKKNRSLTHVIIAHQIVNIFAFYSTFIINAF